MIEKEINKTIPSNPELLPDLEKVVTDLAKEINLDENKSNNLALSVAEAASNSIMHGNKMDMSKKIDISIKVYADRIEISLKDQGKGFKPSDIPDPTIPENILKDSGRGIHIMKTFLDDLKYNFTDEGTEVTLVLKR